MLLNYLKIMKDIFTFSIVSWNMLNTSRLNSLWNQNICCLSYTANDMSADALLTLGVRASTGMALIPKAGIFRFQHSQSKQ